MTTPRQAPTTEAERGFHGRAGPFPAWLLFVALITLEYIAISYRIDAKDLLIHTGLQRQLGGIGTLAPLGFLIAVATYFAGGKAAAAGLVELKDFRSSRSALLLWSVLHVAVYAASFYVVEKATGKLGKQTPTWCGWAFIWLALIVASTSLLIVSFWPFSTVARAFRIARKAIQVGLIVGAGAFVAGMLSRLLWPYLARFTLELVHAMLTVIASDTVAAPEDLVVGTARFYVEIAPECSGVEGVGLTVAFIGVYLYLWRSELRWPQAFAIVPISAVAIWLLNIVRITGLIAIGTWGWPEVALGGFHSKAGWVFFTIVALGAVLVTQRFPMFRKTERLSETSSIGVTPKASRNAAAAYLMPMLTVIAVGLLTGLASSGLDRLYALRVLAGLIALWAFRDTLPRLECGRSSLALLAGLAVGVAWVLGATTDPAAKKAVADGLGQLSTTEARFWIAARIAGSVAIAPVVEELAFRGFLLRRIASWDFERVSLNTIHWVALAGSSIAFGLLHSEWLLGILAGFVYGLVTVPNGRLSDAVLAHATTNLTLVASALATGDWSVLS